MYAIDVIKKLLKRYADLKNCVILFDDQLLFADNSTPEEWGENVKYFLQDSDELISQFGQVDTEFVSEQLRLRDILTEKYNRKNVFGSQTIDRVNKNVWKKLDVEHPKIDTIEEPFVGCMDKIREMNERAELLQWLQKKYEDSLTDISPIIRLTDQYGEYVFDLDNNHHPTKVS